MLTFTHHGSRKTRSMNKAELVDLVATELKVSKVAASKSVEAVFKGIAIGVARQDKVAISGFGTFKKKFRNARTGRNPATNEEIHIAPSFTVGFSPSQMLKDRLADDSFGVDIRANGQARAHSHNGHVEAKRGEHHHHAHHDAHHEVHHEVSQADIRLT